VQVCHCYWHNSILHSSYWPSSIIKLY
jgi:hypothetical protein